MKKALLTMLTVAAVTGSSLTVFAAPETMPDGTLFDAEYYAQTYPDVAAVFGTDKEALYNHYVTLGKAEGRNAYDSMVVQPTENPTTPTNSMARNITADVLVIMGDMPEFMLTDSRPTQMENLALKNSGTITKHNYSYDAQGRLVKYDDASYIYDTEGRLVQYNNFVSFHDRMGGIYDEQGRMTKYAGYDLSYDGQEFLTKALYYDGSTVYNIGYNEQGKLAWYTKGTGIRRDYSYDAQGRLTRVTYYESSKGTTPYNEYVFGYDSSGKLTSEDVYIQGVLYHKRTYR